MLQQHFNLFRKNIVGIDQKIETPFGLKKIIYADWIASGRLYAPVEQNLLQHFYPFVANTHTDSNSTGAAMTFAYHKAFQIIKKHVNACPNDDILISSNSGMTGVVNKLQRILGLRIHENFKQKIKIQEADRPIVFISHMEHHSNQTS